MKVGVMGCFYNCEEFLPSVLAPWIELKQQGAPLLLTAVNAQFTEYAELGYENNDEATQALLRTYEPYFDLLHIAREPITETEIRNISLHHLLKQEVDLVWILDGDEIYTREQILKILQYIENTPQFDYYHISFDNRIFGLKSTDNFAPPRIFRTKRHGGITGFIFDNTISYADETDIYNWTPGIVPKKVAHVLHYTWNKKDAVQKINFQRKHYGFCSFTYNKDTKTFGFDESFFKLYNLPFPTVRDGYIDSSKRPSAQVVLTLDEEERKAGRMLTSTYRALLALERLNEFEIHLIVIAPPLFHTSIRTVLEILPFNSEVVTQMNIRKNAENTVYLDGTVLDKTPKGLWTYMRKIFKSSTVVL